MLKFYFKIKNLLQKKMIDILYRVLGEVEGVCGVLALLPANHCVEQDLPSKEHQLLVRNNCKKSFQRKANI